MTRARNGLPSRLHGLILATALVSLLAVAGLSRAQSGFPAGFQIVWVVIGEAAGAGTKSATRAGRQLFMASDLVPLSLKNIAVSRVTAEPSVVVLEPGRRLCVSALDLKAFDAGQRLLEGAPLSISVRQDHRAALRLTRTKHDVCMRPTQPGEYPIRFTSLLPAPDGSRRGAQLFVRVAADEPSPAADNSR